MAVETERARPRRVAFLLDNLNGGGAERVVLDIASGFADLGYEVDLLVCELQGALCESVPRSVNLIVLQPGGKFAGLVHAIRRAGWHGLGGVLSWVVSAGKIPRSFCYIRAISDYLRVQQPAVISSALGKSNISAVLAAAAAGIETRVFAGVHIAHSFLSEQSRRSGKGQTSSMVPMLRYCYSKASGVIAVSRGVADDAINFLAVDPAHVHVVYNPIVAQESAEGAEALPAHPWFRAGAPAVILGMGRLAEQKNFPLLIKAFAAVRQQADVRLAILGGGSSPADFEAQRRQLQELADHLGVGEDLALLGYQSNPHTYLRAARLFVLSSNFEGFGNVLVEALLAGCPVVSTDCPSGPAEILDGGQYGALVPVNDVESMAQAILASLAAEPQADILRRRGSEFSLDRAVAGYHQVFFGEPAAGVVDELPVRPSSYAISHANGSHRIIHSSLGRVTT